MHARASSMAIEPDKVAEFTRIIREDIAATGPWQEGAQRYLVLTDMATGNCIGLSLWETEDHLKAFDSSPLVQSHIAKIAHHFTSPPVGAYYEVGVEDIKQLSLPLHVHRSL